MATTQITADAPRFFFGGLTSPSWEDQVRSTAGKYVEDFDVDAIVKEWTEELDALLPDSWSLSGECIFANCDKKGNLVERVTDREALAAAANAVDLADIMERHCYNIES